MARPPQYPLDDGDSMAVAKLKVTLKEASPETRAHILKWLAKFYNDSGGMFSPSITQERRRVTIDGETFWLLKVPMK
jgi:hypothetical protein